MAEAEQKGRQETRDRLGEVVNRPEADHSDDHGTPRIDAGDVRHPEVRGGTRNDDQTDVIYEGCDPWLERELASDPNHPTHMYLTRHPMYVTNPNHGGKITCELCNGFIDGRFRYKKIGDRYQHLEENEACNPYLNYYGPGKPID